MKHFRAHKIMKGIACSEDLELMKQISKPSKTS